MGALRSWRCALGAALLALRSWRCALGAALLALRSTEKKMCIEHVFFQHVFFFGPDPQKFFRTFFLRLGSNFPERCVSTRQARTYLYRVASSNRLEVMTEILGPGIAEAKKQN